MKRFITKVYLYDSSQSDYKGEDYSSHLLTGDSDIDNLDDTLDTYEMTLAGLNFREEFAPSSKFIIEKYQDEVSIENIVKTWNFIVKDDTVSQPIISDDTYFDHHLTLIECGAEAQNRLVDNIAVTYKLQDVSIDVLPTYNTKQKMQLALTNSPDFVPNRNFQTYYEVGFWYRETDIGHRFYWQFPSRAITLTNPLYDSNGDLVLDGNGDIQYETLTNHIPSWSDWDKFYYQTIAPHDQVEYIELPIPNLICAKGTWGTQTSFTDMGCCSIMVTVRKKSLGNIIAEDKYYVNPNSNDQNENSWTRDYDYAPKGYIMSNGYWGQDEITNRMTAIYTHCQVVTYGTTYNGEVIDQSFTTLLDRVLHIEIEPDYSYEVILNLRIFNNDYPVYYCFKKVYWASVWNNTPTINNENLFVNTKFQAVKMTERGKVVFQHSPPANAYDLFNKCQIASKVIEKQPNVIIDETPKAFYLNESDRNKLQNTTIVENFYNQKNLWQVFMDIGKYIHARPKIVFGDNDNFLVGWKQYGLTDQYTNNAYPISVYNSKFIEEYICALSSYVSNMVQLGGTITEFVAPKSSSEDYLVYNDVAELVVSKPIIELVKVFVTNSNGDRRCLATDDLTDITHGERASGYIFEEGIYKCLDVVSTTNINKGNSIYYTLGSNKIVGLNYRLPKPNNDADYAIKVILAEVFGIANSATIKVNDYTFEIIYRTKDTLRADQTRPDLRDYLLSNRFDEVPVHDQFNNQQDIVVDSAKFGNNMYGKLIRTGNTVYTKIEWVDDLTKLKHSGELYNIFGNLYYVSKVKNTYYQSHAVSEVEFTRDFNRLSQIIGIPSEPRFYEISEQSFIDREIALDDYFYLNTRDFVSQGTPRTYIKDDGKTYLNNLLFNATSDYPKYAVTIFKGDIDKNNTFKKTIISPLSTYSIGTSLTMEYDMVDNFSAGDQIDTTVTGNLSENSVNGSYYGLKPYQYCDEYGRVDLMDFAILDDVFSLTQTQIRNFPECPISEENIDPLFGNHDMGYYGSNADGIGLLKDNREVIKVNYNIQVITDSDRFVISPYIWQQDKGELRLALVTTETNKLSNATIIFDNNTIKYDDIAFTTSINANGNIEIDIGGALTAKATALNITLEELMEDVKSIIIYSSNVINQNPLSSEKYFTIARNIGDLTLAQATTNWYFSIPDKTIYQKQ